MQAIRRGLPAALAVLLLAPAAAAAQAPPASTPDTIPPPTAPQPAPEPEEESPAPPAATPAPAPAQGNLGSTGEIPAGTLPVTGQEVPMVALMGAGFLLAGAGLRLRLQRS